MLTQEQNQIHEKALRLSLEFKKSEIAMIDVLGEVDSKRVYLALGFSSLFEYAAGALGLSESNAYSFISVSRKSKEIPELKESIRSGELTVSKAKRILPVLNSANKTSWISKATTLTKAALETEVLREKPELLKKEVVRKVQVDRVSLSFHISDKVAQKLKRVQGLLGESGQSNLESTLEALLDLYLEKKDPIEKAKRVQNRNCARAQKGAQVSGAVESVQSGGGIVQVPHSLVRSKRTPIPAHIKHQVFLRDRGQCQYRARTGSQCQNHKWLHIHHIQEVAQGGGNELTNLKLLCSAHHSFHHSTE